jgi:hypothetical protein
MKSSSEALKKFCHYYVIKNRSVMWFKESKYNRSHTVVMSDMQAYVKDFNRQNRPNSGIDLTDVAELSTRFINSIEL